MLTIENTEVFGWEAAIRGARNPMNSWDRMDSNWGMKEDPSAINPNDELYFFVGDNDLKLMKNLAKAGSDHAKYLRMINVTVDITAPLYWWKEFDTYKVGTVANSCSTMHKIHDKEFTIDDFSHEHLLWSDRYVPYLESGDILYEVITMLNIHRKKYIETKDKTYWWQMIQLLPSSYNQKRTIQLNYEVLRSQYNARKNHKLDEWHEYCDWIKTLPYAKELIIGEE